MALDLADNHEVTATDVSQEALDRLRSRGNVEIRVLDASNKAELQAAIADFDIVLSAVPGFLGFEVLKSIIEAGKDVVDISFFPENSLDLHELAESKGVTALVDIGVAPGMDNIILGYYNSIMKLDRFRCMVGGLPKVRKWPFAYKAPFSPVDVIEEYVRPARYVENGHLVTRPALSDAELIDFEHAGTLEAFNTDGLRSILFTMDHIPNMIEKTLRYPGHIQLIQALQASGFFSEEPIHTKNGQVVPLEVTSRILIDEWKLGDTEPEFTVMRVEVEGEGKCITYDLYDEYDPETQVSSMARTTGYTATAAVNLLNDGLFDKKGVFPPELISDSKAIFDHFINYLKDRNIHYRRSEKASS